ncbi:hypothetical protein [Bordetella hinzii]|uniref:hypothetical protein n=1 Tax=Bordetella hinzii TaxID=103855 RepID=UPI0039FC5A17
MVDFAQLRTQKKKATQTEPLEIFRRLPKPPGINDLYTSQAEVLDTWYQRRKQRDIVLKLHTGGGKTLVGLLMAQSTINETNEPVHRLKIPHRNSCHFASGHEHSPENSGIPQRP